MSKQDDELKEQLAQIRQMLEQLNETSGLIQNLLQQLDRSHLNDILQNYSRPRRVILINLTAGLARGIGLTVGTAIFLGILAFILGQFISLPVIGEYIARLLDIIDAYRMGGFTP